MKRMKWYILLTLLCGTFFISEFGCDTESYSSGFAYPHLTIDTDDGVVLRGDILVSIAVNLAFVIACVTLMLKLDLEARKQFQKKIFFSLLFNIVIYNIFAFTHIYIDNPDSTFVKIVVAVPGYYCFVLPFVFAGLIDEYFIITGGNLDILSRVCFLLMTGFIFLLFTLFGKLRKRMASIQRAAEKSQSPDR